MLTGKVHRKPHTAGNCNSLQRQNMMLTHRNGVCGRRQSRSHRKRELTNRALGVSAWTTSTQPTSNLRCSLPHTIQPSTTRLVSVHATMTSTRVENVNPSTSTSTFKDQLDTKLGTLQQNKAKWATLPIADKIVILKEIEARVLEEMYSWGRAGAAIKGMDNDPWAVAESTLITPVVAAKYLTAIRETYEELLNKGKCPEVAKRVTPSGQTIARVWPVKESDVDARHKGVTVDLYIKPGQPDTQGTICGPKSSQGGKVAACLGAGNLGFLGLKDALYMLFEQNNVILFKPHPIQAEWHKFADRVLEPLSSRGFYQSIYTDSVDETREMLYHPQVELVHMTGGTATHDSIVWGTMPEEQARRRAANDPVLKVPITSELGCVTPWIVTPGAWTEAQLKDQATSIASVLYLNNGCACNAIKVLVLPETWPQGDTFISKIKEELLKLPLQPAFYPGHNQRYNAWRSVFPKAELIETPAVPSTKSFGGAQPMPYAIQEVPYPKPGQSLTEQQKYAFTVEPFAPVLTVVRIPSTSAPAYMAATTEFANRTLWGSLTCTVLVHPDMERDHMQAVNKMLDELEYGVVAANCYSGGTYALPHAIWGAYGGNQTTKDVGSGIGHVNNTLLFDYPRKIVARFPLINGVNPKPIKSMGLPVWALGPITGLMVNGVKGLKRAVFSWK